MGFPRGLGALVYVGAIGWLAACEPVKLPIAPTTPLPMNPFSSPAAPPVRRTIAGTARDMNGGPIPGVEIDGWPSPDGRQTAVTAQDGSFRIDETVFERLMFFKDGYQPGSRRMPPGSNSDSTQTAVVTMQRSLVVSVDSAISSVVVPNDPVYFNSLSPVGPLIYFCGPCKLINVSGGEGGVTLTLYRSGSVPVVLLAGDSLVGDTLAGLSVHATSASPDCCIWESSASEPVHIAMVGIDARAPQPLTEPVAFTLVVEKR